MISRRTFIASGVAATAAACTPIDVAPVITVDNYMDYIPDRHWSDHFSSVRQGAIICDTGSRALYHWTPGGDVHTRYPTSVPRSPEFTRLGRTQVVRKQVGPTWRPTPRMLRENPDWPRVVEPGPNNPLGSHAMYLTWPAYLIHGTEDNNKIGRLASSGCIGLRNEDIATVYAATNIGCPVILI